MCSLLQFPPYLRRSLGLWSTSQLDPVEWSNTRSLELSIRCLLSKVISFILCTLYILCIVFWYYPLFVAICEIWLLKLIYGAYLVLSLKSGITYSSHGVYTYFVMFLECPHYINEMFHNYLFLWSMFHNYLWIFI